MFQQFMFYVLAAIAVVSGIFVITGKNPISCAIALIVTLGAVAGLFVLLDAHFVATIQILVYAGAIMVLFVFVIMLLNLRHEELETRRFIPWSVASAGLAGLACVLLVLRFLMYRGTFPAVPAEYGTLSQVSIKLFTEYVIPFEVISVLLMAAVVGAVVIAKRDL